MLANISYFGKGLLAAVFFLYGFTAVLGLAALKLESSRAERVLYQAGRGFLAGVGLSVVALVLLIIAFLTDDFSVAAVAQYSSIELGFFYKSPCYRQ